MSSASTNQSASLLSIAQENGQPDSDSGLRKHTRYTLGMRVEISTDPSAGTDVQSVLVHNVSAGGIGVWTERQFAVGSNLSVLDVEGSCWIDGTVQHASPGVHGYLVGIQFAENLSTLDGIDGQSDSAEKQSPFNELAASQTAKSSRSALCLPLTLARILKGGIIGTVIAAGVYLGLFILDFEIFPSEIAIGFGGAILIGASLSMIGVRRERRFLEGISAAINALAEDESIEDLPAAPTTCHNAINRSIQKLGNHHRQKNVESRIQRQANLELEEVKSGILSIVSYDICQPLNAIQQHAEVLREEVDSLSRESRLDLIETIAQQSTSIAQQIGDLEELQRLDKETHESAETFGTACCLEDAIAESVASFEALAESRSIGLRLDCPTSLPPALADADKISRALRRLMSNAIAGTPTGGSVQVNVEERPCELVVSVADNGAGIPRERWGAAFDRAAIADASDEAKFEPRVGLGLYIARRIVESYQGRIWLDSELENGAVVYFAIPTIDTTADEPVSIEPFAGNCRVVVCDSDPELASMMAQALRQQNYHVSIAHCGSRLVDLLDREPFDVVLTDVQLPDMSTSELLTALHGRRDMGFATILHSFEDGLESAHRMPIVAYLHRPADRRRLYEAVALAAKRRLATGQTIFLLEHGSVETRRLRGAMEEAGHVVVSCGTMKDLSRLLRCYRCDSYIVPQAAVRGDWGEVLKIQGHDGDAGAMMGGIQPIVLVDEVRKSERGVSDQFGIKVVAYRPGFESDVVASLEPERADQAELVGAP